MFVAHLELLRNRSVLCKGKHLVFSLFLSFTSIVLSVHTFSVSNSCVLSQRRNAAEYIFYEIGYAYLSLAAW